MEQGTKKSMPGPSRHRIILKGLNPKQREALISGGYMTAGIAAGLGLSSLFSVASSETLEPEPAPEPLPEAGPEIVIYTEAPMAYGVHDQMNFADAFEAARNEIGAGGFFEWRGTTYNTYYAEELEAMSPEELADYQASLQDYIVNKPVEEYSYQPVDYSTDIEEPSTAYEPATDDEPASDSDAELVNDSPTEEMIPVDLNQDGVVDAIAMNTDSDEYIEVIAIDTDHNDQPDLYMIDSDDDNMIDLLVNDPDEDGLDGTEEMEVLEAPELITLEDLRPDTPSIDKPVESSHDNYQADEFELDESEELPDFDNDADVSQFT